MRKSRVTGAVGRAGDQSLGHLSPLERGVPMIKHFLRNLQVNASQQNAKFVQGPQGGEKLEPRRELAQQ